METTKAIGYTIIAIIITAITVTAIIATQPKPDVITVNKGLVPLDLYPIKLDGWRISVSFDGSYNTVTGIKSDYWQATKDGYAVDATSLSELIRQIRNIEQNG